MVNRWTLFLLILGFPLRGQSAYDKGMEYYREGKRDLALENLTQASLDDPQNDGPFFYLAVMYHSSGELELAEKNYREGRTLRGPFYLDLTFNLANLYFNQGLYPQAEELYEEMLFWVGDYRTQSLLNLANLSVQTESYEQAISLYKEYLQVNPETPQRQAIQAMVALLEKAVTEEVLKKEESLRLQAAAQAREKASGVQDRQEVQTAPGEEPLQEKEEFPQGSSLGSSEETDSSGVKIEEEIAGPGESGLEG